VGRKPAMRRIVRRIGFFVGADDNSAHHELQDSDISDEEINPVVRSRRRSLTTSARFVQDASAEGSEAAELPLARRSTVRAATCPGPQRRPEMQWADPNACSALCELILADRRLAKLGTAPPGQLPMDFLAQNVAPFLQFSAPLPNMIYVLGGRSEANEALATVEMFDTWHGRWTQSPGMPTCRVGAAAAVLSDRRLLVTGGHGDRGVIDGVLATCDAYDVDAEKWTAVASMGRGRWGHGCAALGDKVYIAGGCGLPDNRQPAAEHLDTLKSCEVYLQSEDKWAPCSPLNVARSGARVVALGQHYLAAVGGCANVFTTAEELSTVELFDVRVSQWFLLEQRLQRPRPTSAVAAIDDQRLLIVGGWTDPASTEVYEVVPPSTDSEGAEVLRSSRRQQRVRKVKFDKECGAKVAIPDIPDSRRGGVAASLTLPQVGSRYPLTGCPSVAVLCGESQTGSQGGSAVTDVQVFDVKTNSWRSDSVIPAMYTARCAAAVCVGFGRVALQTQ